MNVLEVKDLGISLPKGGDRPLAVSRVSFAVARRNFAWSANRLGKSVIAQA
jgi:hypothetical protein